MSCVYNTERHGVKLDEHKMLISQCVSCYIAEYPVGPDVLFLEILDNYHEKL